MIEFFSCHSADEVLIGYQQQEMAAMRQRLQQQVILETGCGPLPASIMQTPSMINRKHARPSLKCVRTRATCATHNWAVITVPAKDRTARLSGIQ